MYTYGPPDILRRPSLAPDTNAPISKSVEITHARKTNALTLKYIIIPSKCSVQYNVLLTVYFELP